MREATDAHTDNFCIMHYMSLFAFVQCVRIDIESGFESVSLNPRVSTVSASCQY